MEEALDPTSVLNIAEAFVRDVHAEWTERATKWKTDFAHLEVHEVVGALVARQAALAICLAETPRLWNWDVAALFLRPMTEVYLNLACVVADPDARVHAFILHGLGQAKLRVEHLKTAQDNAPANRKELFSASVDELERWIDSQQYRFLTEVNLGSWSETNLRKMAEEVDELSFYNYCYTLYSAGVHSMWHHIGIYNLRQCMNPLHRFHKVPAITVADADVHFLYLASKYLRMVFEVFDRFTKIAIESPSANQMLTTRLSELAKSDADSAYKDESTEALQTSRDGLATLTTQTAAYPETFLEPHRAPLARLLCIVGRGSPLRSAL